MTTTTTSTPNRWRVGVGGPGTGSISTRRRTARRALAVALLSSIPLATASNAWADTSQFRGVNWADARDNFQSGVLYVSGLSASDTYDSAFATGTSVMTQFRSKLGANAVRMPINEATVSSFWDTYTGALDAVLDQGMLVVAYWDSAKSNKPPDMNAFWAMWQTVVDRYGDDDNAYFEIFNEPNMYSKDDLIALYETWLSRFASVPRGRVLLDGTGNAQNVPDIGSASSLDGCLLAVHDYSFFGSDAWTSEAQWANHLKGEVGSYADRTVCTEWGGPMSPGSKNGISYGSLDYSVPPTNYFEAYIRGIGSQLRSWKMGSFYWPGLRDGDWYSMTTRSGTGAELVLSVPNQSGLAQLQDAWTGPPPTGTGGAGGNGGTAGSGGGAGGRGVSGAGGSSGLAGASGGGRGGMAAVSGGVGGIPGGVAGGPSGGAAGGALGRAGEDGLGTSGTGGTAGPPGASSGGTGGTNAATAGAGGVFMAGGGGAGDSSSAAASTTATPAQGPGCACSVERAASGGDTGRFGLLLGLLGLSAAAGRRRRAIRAQASSSRGPAAPP